MDLTNQFDEVKKLVNEFQKDNDRRIKEVETKRASDPLLIEKIEKQDKALEGMVERLEKMQTALNRAGGTPADQNTDKEVEKKLSGIMAKYMKKGERFLTDEETKFFSAEMAKKGLTVGSDPEGGYMVRPEVSTQITKKAFESSPVRMFSDSITIGTDAFEEPADFDEPDASWAGETSSRSETDENNLSMLRIATHEIYANPRATQKLLEDAYVDIEAWHAAKVADKFARSEAAAFVTGNGITRPRGFCAYSHGTSYGQVEQVAAATSATIAADDLINLQYTLFDAYQQNARFMMHRTTAKHIRKLKDGQGRYLWSMEGNLQDGFQQTLLGKPMHWAADMAELAADALAVAYGDFKQGYLIVDRIGISVLRDPFSAKPHVEFYTRKRVGGGVRNYQAIKLLKLATSVS